MPGLHVSLRHLPTLIQILVAPLCSAPTDTLSANTPKCGQLCEATFYEQDLSERICAAGALCPKPLLVDRTEDGDLTICRLTFQVFIQTVRTY